VVLAEVSRLVVDVGRFRDDAQEQMTQVGMGAVYTHTHDGRRLRQYSAELREDLLRKYYDPHHERLNAVVGKCLGDSGACLILDIHSFPSRPLPYEQNQNGGRPEICLGTDDFHTCPTLREKAAQFYQARGFRVVENEPFSGTIVPSPYYQRDPRVQSLMVEFNRSLLMDETNGLMRHQAIQIMQSVRDLAEVVTSD